MGPFKPLHILAFGATGNIGKHIVNQLIRANPPFPKISIFTSANTVSNKPELLARWKDAGISVIVGDITSSADVKNAYQGVDTAISCLGRGALELQFQLIKLADESDSVRWFFPSEYGTDPDHDPSSAHEKPHQLKRRVRKLFAEEVKNLKPTFLVVGPYIEMWVDGGALKDAFGGIDVEKKEATLLGDGEQPIGFTAMDDVGKAMVAALKRPEVSFGKILKIASFTKSAKQVLAEFEKQLGQEFNVKYIPLDDAKSLEKKYWDEGNPAAVVGTLRRIWATGGAVYDKLDNEDLGLHPDQLQSLEVAVRNHLDKVPF
ncbi:NAD(P)-binding protein [Trichoderma citrinoviride]|uniref:NAD(P)-binding protein n=1 Tax=Trichoderma citrinoviride TaxID=58853 RepID=A0A2T4B6V6_9HYPO|nr:NAD(P)-binding protein [Trichoderma citrinoviride]PTB64941.1 NAD(P)-binding protein [Trichoderma citrinoviride]